MIIKFNSRTRKNTYNSLHSLIERNASNHHLQNQSSQLELCHKLAHQRILDILKQESK